MTTSSSTMILGESCDAVASILHSARMMPSRQKNLSNFISGLQDELDSIL